MIIDEGVYLSHYGILRRSGRYPWGSGEFENTHNKLLIDHISNMRKQGLTEAEIAKGLGMSVSALRAEKSIAVNQQRQANIAMAQRLKDKGLSDVAIGNRMGVAPNTVKNYLAPGAKDKSDVLNTTAKMLKEEVDNSNGLEPLDVGRGAESHIGVSSTKLDSSLAILKQQGYEVHTVPVPQVGTGKDTKTKVLCPPGTTQRDAFLARNKIKLVNGSSDDGGRTFQKIHEPIELDPKRVDVVYGPDGGSKSDGMIFVRPNVKDVSLGGAQYAQVRVAVGPDHYLKGMATYRDDLPKGVDVQFHTNKESTGNKLDVMKKNSDDLVPGSPEGQQHPLLKSTRKQIVENVGLPNERVTSAMNIVNEEGNWSDWSRSLSSQMLSKQKPELAKTQLDMTYENRVNNFEAIKNLTNPTVRKKMLSDFADATDSAAVHLKAAALPRQGSHVILPIATMKPTEIYAPNFRNGEKVVLIRHPHAGTFEIPELVVNNRQPEAKRLLGNKAPDAVGIHHSVAERLSGADFDGDTVLVIPNERGRVTHTSALEGLKNFDPKSSYPAYEGMKRMSKGQTQTEMGKISNLITDMSLGGASHSELTRAVKHSMVVIDAEKHNLNYKLSYNDNGIKQLKEKYQTGGASTLISRAGAKIRIPEQKPRPHALGGPVDLNTGRKITIPTNRPNSKGEPRLQKVKRLAIEDDAHRLSSGTPMEVVYANHSNRLKALANKARLESVKTPTPKYSPSAKKTYAKEVQSLNHQLNLALRNAPLERQAQVIANANISARRAANPAMDKDTLKKISYQALQEARARTGASKLDIDFTQGEWDAIQAGAISNSKLTQILQHAKPDRVRELATPKNKVLMTPTKIKRAEQMLADGYTRADVADQLGVSLSTLDTGVKGE